MWLTLTLVVGMSILSEPISAAATVLSAPVLRDTTKTPGQSFSIDIKVASVEKMWGYDFFVYYNTTVLTATGAASYSPFTEKPMDPVINDTAGYVYVVFHMPMGERVGFSTVQPQSIVKMDFTVDAVGVSPLDISKPSLANVEGAAITHRTVDGLFANVEIDVHDVAVTGVTVSETTVPVGGSVTITVTIENTGDFDESFSVSVYYDSVLIGTPASVTLSAGATATKIFTWSTVGVAEKAYTITAEASTVSEEIDTANNVYAYGKVTVGGAGTDLTLYYIIAGVAVIAIALILLYRLRIRKPRTK